MPNRNDLMSLNTINQSKDLFRVKTAVSLPRNRQFSNNLETRDIQGNHSLIKFTYFRLLSKEVD